MQIVQISKNRELVKYIVAHLFDGIKRKINTLNTHTHTYTRTVITTLENMHVKSAKCTNIFTQKLITKMVKSLREIISLYSLNCNIIYFYSWVSFLICLPFHLVVHYYLSSALISFNFISHKAEKGVYLSLF